MSVDEALQDGAALAAQLDAVGARPVRERIGALESVCAALESALHDPEG